MGDLYQDMAPVIGSSQSAYEALLNESIDELDGAVVLQLHSFGQCANGRLDPVRQAANRKKQLMLLRFDPRLPGRILAKTEKATNLIAQFRHCFKVNPGSVTIHIVVRYYRNTIDIAKALEHSSYRVDEGMLLQLPPRLDATFYRKSDGCGRSRG